MHFEGRPRSIAEMEFIARMFPCERCGERRPLELETGGSGDVWVVTGTCARCRNELRFVFETDEDLFAVDQPDLELGDDEPSRIIGPFELMREIDRLVPAIVVEPSRLEDPAWTANSDAVERVLTAFLELAKFLRRDEAAIAPESHRDAAGLADQRARPERYTRAWIDEEHARWEVIAAAIADDAPRVFAADPMLSRSTPPRGAIGPETVADHRAWIARGQTGDGRLDVVTWDGDELEAEAARLAGARLEGVGLRRANLRSAWLDDAELVEVDLTDAVLDRASLDGATVTACNFGGASAIATSFENSRIIGGSFEKTRLDLSRWAGAEVEGVNFRGALLTQASVEGARFLRCDFRGAALGRSDFTGAQLIDCKFAGAYGAPIATDGWSVIDPDFSDAADRSDLGDAEDLLDELRN